MSEIETGAEQSVESTETTAETTTESTAEYNFRDYVSEDFKGKYTSIKDVDTLMRSYDGAVKKIGDPDSYIKIPGEGEDRTEFNLRMGVPAKVEDYEVNLDSVPEDIRDEEFLGIMRQAAYDAAVPKDAFAKMVDAYNEQAVNAYNQNQSNYKEAYDKAKQELGGEWGNNFDDNLKVANEFLDKNANNPAFLKTLYKLATDGEDSMSAPSGSMSASTIDARIAEIDKKLFGPEKINSMDPQYNTLLAEKTKLFQQKVQMGSR